MEPSNMEFLFVGTYSIPGPYFEANGPGICTLGLNPKTGGLSELSVCVEGTNATYLDKIPGKPHLLAASDKYFDPGAIECYRIDPNDGSLSHWSSESVLGNGTCHLSLNHKGTQAYVSSYNDARMTVHNVIEGKVSKPTQSFAYEGSSVNKARQETAHAHQAVTSPDSRWLYVTDLGSDRIWIHELSNLDANPAHCEMPPGAGPRHMVCHPELPLIYLLCELDARLITFRYDDKTGALEAITEQPTLPQEWEAAPSAAAIRLHPSLKTLYVSNRTHNSIAFMRLNKDGLPSEVRHIPSHGNDPRDFRFNDAGTWMVVANQYSDCVASFAIDPDSGLPKSNIPACVLPCGSPVTLVFY